MNRAFGLGLACIGVLAGAGPTRAGHGVVYTPSYYPQEIAIETIDPVSAAAQLRDKTLHAYVGSAPRSVGDAQEYLRAIRSIESFLVLTFNPASSKLEQPERRCAAAAGIAAALARRPGDMVVHPYPVTPFHSDYLQHLDRIEAAAANVRAKPAIDPELKFRVAGGRARAIVPSQWPVDDDDWDVSVDEVPVDRVLSPRLPGWPGPPWMKEGWFQAYELLAPAVVGPDQRQSANALYRRLTNGGYANAVEQLNLQRRLIANLMHGCERTVLGYALRREYYNDAYEGVENVAFDSQLGLNTPIFVRTVKLKDFPWNGWLRLGMKERPEAAWNPIGGFTDGPGRLIWSAVADPPLLPMPYNGSWIPDRVKPAVTLARPRTERIALPADAVLPEAGTGTLEPVGERKSSLAKVVYRVSASRFHDGTDTEVSDLLYPYVLAYRWGARANGDDRTYDPAIDSATAWMRERLVGLRVDRVDQAINDIAPDIQVPLQIPVIEIYVDCTVRDPLQVAALAPPWSPVPWHLSVLMEAAVQRGWAAFSQEEADRLAVSWLDVVRDRSLHDRLTKLVEEFETSAYRPAALNDLVTEENARRRWHALKEFAASHNHFLVTSGPYRLKAWTPTSATVQVDRELTYPHGVGRFNYYAYPPHAIITKLVHDANRMLVYADVEKVVREQRVRHTVREPLGPRSTRELFLIRSDPRYILLGPDGSVVQADAAKWEDDDHFVAQLPQRLPPGRYTFLVAIYLNGNTVEPATRMTSFEIPAS